MSIQKRLFIWQTILVILYSTMVLIYGGSSDIFIFIYFAIILFAPIEILYLMRLRKRGKLAGLNKIFRVICYILLIPAVYPVLLFFYVYAYNFWQELFYINADGNMLFWQNRWMLHAPIYQARYLLLISLLLGMILINKKMPKE